MSNYELLPCPFCGGEAHTHDFSWHASQFAGHIFANPYWQVICSECRAAIGDFDTRDEAIEAWNTRSEIPRLTCELEETESYSNALEVIHVLECSECGETCEHTNGSYPRCPHCGRKAVEQ